VTINAPVRTTTRSTRSIGWVPFALVALVLVPAIAGSLRLVELAGGPHVLPANRQPGTGELAYLFRLAFGSAMAASIILGFAAIRRGDVTRHQAWMTRAYALALGAGTQVVSQGIGSAVSGTSEFTNDLSLGAGWAINLAVAEYVIRRHGSSRTISRWTIRATTKVGSS
jgi:Predicted membrane protein (DUF2306)